MKATITLIWLLLCDMNTKIKFVKTFFFHESLPVHTTAEALFKVVSYFMTTKKLQWAKCAGISTDGAQAISRIHKGLVARIQKVPSLVKWTHCCLYRGVLAARRMPSEMKTEALKIVIPLKPVLLTAGSFCIW
jgi:hypothetical protein